jgi:hypothetical protein
MDGGELSDLDASVYLSEHMLGEKLSSYSTESDPSILETVIAVEECRALLEEFRDEFTEVQQQSSDDKGNSPSEDESPMVQEKWLAFEDIAGRLRLRWEDLMDLVRGHMKVPTSPTMHSALRKDNDIRSGASSSGVGVSRLMPLVKEILLDKGPYPIHFEKS